ncbi:MAG: cytochrome c oxidase assembly protein [Candidatus Rokuibacteriota bacterium]
MTSASLLLAWKWRSDVALVVVALGTVYLVGWYRLRRCDPRAAAGWRLALYLGGLATLCLALLSPIDSLGSLLFFVHMIQHELLTMVAPPLLLLGNPFPVVVWGLPAAWRLPVARLLVPGAWFRKALWAVTAMPVTWPLYVVTLWVWHWPPAYEASLRSGVVHDAQHLSFFVTALLFWWPIVNPAPMLHGHRHHALRVAYVIPATLQSQMLGLIFAFSSRLFYPHYEAVPRLWGFMPLQDQSAAGLLMMPVEGLIYLFTVLLLVSRMFSYEERMTQLREEHGLEP